MRDLPVTLLGSLMLVTPVLLIWGWVRWARTTQPRSFSSKVALVSFSLATASAVLAIIAGVMVFVLTLHDLLFVVICRVGLVLSIGAMVCGLLGMERRSSLRWHAPLSSAGTLFFWIVMFALTSVPGVGGH